MKNISKLLSNCSYDTYCVFNGFFKCKQKKINIFSNLFFSIQVNKYLFIFNLFTKTFNTLINFIQKKYLIKFIYLIIFDRHHQNK